MEYPAKVLLAWGEAISGNAGLRDWLIKNGYPELGIFTFALRLKKDAREWLMKNGHPHLLALITGVEGDEGALKWLADHGMHTILHMARAGDGEKDSLKWLLDHGHKELAIIALKINEVKTGIDDAHTFTIDG
ncbi:MAG: hypothetical protein WAU70_00485 [Flavobacteriales bacterium]